MSLNSIFALPGGLAVRGAVAMLLGLSAVACGGGRDAAASESAVESDDVVVADDPPSSSESAASVTTTSVTACERVPPAPLAANRRTARSFGATVNDERDDSAAVQRALDTLLPGETLWFEPGRYVFNRSLHVRRPGITITGSDAVIHSTNPDDQALLIEADNTTVDELTFTAVTQGRRNAPRHARIAVVSDQGGGNYRAVRNTVIRDNRIINGGPPGSDQANSASTAGIFLMRAERFLVANNIVARTLADGIHITGGSRDGRVLNNTVRETGDDMIAMVSYAGSGSPALNTAQSLLQSWQARVDTRLDRNILVAGNRVSGPYWGRGIALVGGQNITIARNAIDNLPLGSGILLAREANYLSFGVDNVIVEGNALRNIQTMSPNYDVGGKFATARRTGHGSVEVHAALFDDEAADPTLRELLSVRSVLMRNNVVERASVSALRAGVPISGSMSDRNASGVTVTRSYRPGLVEGVSVQVNAFNQVTPEPVYVPSAELTSSGLHCTGNRRDGNSYSARACTATTVEVRGAVLTCGTDGTLR